MHHTNTAINHVPMQYRVCPEHPDKHTLNSTLYIMCLPSPQPLSLVFMGI